MRLIDVPAVLPATLPLVVALLVLVGCDKPARDAAVSAPPIAQTPPPSGDDAGAAGAAQPGIAAAAPDAVTAHWNCDGHPVTANYDNTRHDVRLRIGSSELTLPAAVSGSGARYADAAGNEFWEHQGESTLTLASGKPRHCIRAATAGN